MEAVMKPHHTSVLGCLLPYAAALGIAVASLSPAVAAPGTDAQRAACTPDVFKLCSSDIPNVERIIACLKRERPRLSAACQEVFNAPATRSIPASAEHDTACTFQNQLHPAQKDWHTWCGPKARRQ
jgi:hypothetical protein